MVDYNRTSDNGHVADSIDFMVEQVEGMDRSTLASRLVIGSTRSYVEPQRLRHLNITLIEGFDNPGVSEKLQVILSAGGGGVAMTTFGDLGITSKVLPVVPISPQKSPLILKIVGKSIKFDSVVCFGITLHHILVKFPHFPRKIMGTNGKLRQRFYPESS